MEKNDLEKLICSIKEQTGEEVSEKFLDMLMEVSSDHEEAFKGLINR